MSEADQNGQSPQDEVSTEAKPVLRPGAQLAAHRQTRGWSIEQVANQLNLAPRQIQALENDNYAALPGIVIARGFVRTYAKLLKVDPAPLVAMMADEGTGAPIESIELGRTLSATFTESSLPPSQRPTVSSKFFLSVLLLVLVLGGGWLIHQFGLIEAVPAWLAEKNRQLQSEAIETSSDTEPTELRAEPSLSQTTESGQSIASPSTAARPADNSASGMTDAIQASVNPKDNLVLRFREDSWIEIRRSDQVVLVSRLVMAGATESFEIKHPVHLTIGNAAGVDATLRGKPLDLNANAKTNVARVELK